MGTVKGYEAHIVIKPVVTPRFYKPRPVPYALQQKVEEELDRLLGEGVLQPVQRSK